MGSFLYQRYTSSLFFLIITLGQNKKSSPFSLEQNLGTWNVFFSHFYWGHNDRSYGENSSAYVSKNFWLFPFKRIGSYIGCDNKTTKIERKYNKIDELCRWIISVSERRYLQMHNKSDWNLRNSVVMSIVLNWWN